MRLWDGEPEAGPFWEGGVLISNDFDELHKWIGISRELFEDAMAWHEEYASLRTKPNDDWKRQHFDRQRELLQRLASEVRPGIEVDGRTARAGQPPTDPPAPYGISSARA
ncbi:hypothetical protein FXB39_18670 [Nocardioides sp. BGMRC 2183]|nr:hypothetical protein FXB39_18670 [Nocardioides sp. BGMRC 2183]